MYRIEKLHIACKGKASSLVLSLLFMLGGSEKWAITDAVPLFNDFPGRMWLVGIMRERLTSMHHRKVCVFCILFFRDSYFYAQMYNVQQGIKILEYIYNVKDYGNP